MHAPQIRVMRGDLVCLFANQSCLSSLGCKALLAPLWQRKEQRSARAPSGSRRPGPASSSYARTPPFLSTSSAALQEVIDPELPGRVSPGIARDRCRTCATASGVRARPPSSGCPACALALLAAQWLELGVCVCMTPSPSGSGGDGGLVKVVPPRLCPERGHVSSGRHLSHSVPLLVVFTPSPPAAWLLLESPVFAPGQRAKTSRRCAQTLSSYQRILEAERSLPGTSVGLCTLENSTCRATGRDERSFEAESLQCDLYYS